MAHSFAAARAIILESVAALPPEPVPLLEVVGMVIAEDIRAPWDLPRWNNSAMDGFAVRYEDCAAGQALTIDGYIPAGGSAGGMTVKPGHAVRIMTGAPAPAGCDTIVPVEETEEHGGKIVITGQISRGDHLRVRGEDVVHG